MSFSENLQMIRKKNQLSQKELAELLGVSRQAVSKWELGEGYPEVEKLLKKNDRKRRALSITDRARLFICNVCRS